MTRPWLSVIMPTYNGASYVGTALESVVAQADPDCEVIVVDDGSTDSTLEIVASYANRLNIVVVQREHCGNWIASTNYGMSIAKGEYLCWLHQDDIWSKDRLAALKQILVSRPEIRFAFHPSWYVDDTGKTVGKLRCPFPRNGGLVRQSDLMDSLLVQNYLTPCATIFKASALALVGNCDESLWYVGDWDLWLKLAGLGDAYYHPVPLSSVRLHALSQTVVRATAGYDFRCQYEAILEHHLRRWELSGRKSSVARAARCSAEINIGLASLAAGSASGVGRIAWHLLSLTPGGWFRFISYSRIVERIVARLRANIVTRRHQALKHSKL